MKRVTPGLVLLLLGIFSSGQSQVRSPLVDDPLSKEPATNIGNNQDRLLATRAINALKRLDNHLLVYRSRGDFEDSGKLARVSLEFFTKELGEVLAEVEPLLLRLPKSRMKSEISNALYSYRDGEFWWRKVHQPRVVHQSALSLIQVTHSPPDASFTSTIPYTVAIHWRQANRHLERAEEMMNARK